MHRSTRTGGHGPAPGPIDSLRVAAMLGWAAAAGLACVACVSFDPSGPAPAERPANTDAGTDAGHDAGGNDAAALPAPEVVVSGQAGPRALAADAEYLYWSADDWIWRLAKGGDTPEVVVEVTRTPQSIDVDATSVYWQDYSGRQVLRAPKGGGAAVVLADGLPTSPQWVHVDDDHVYWPTDGLPGAVMRVALAGGPVEVLTEGRGPDRVALDDDHVYWVSGSSTGDGTVNRIHKKTGAEAVLATPGGALRDVAVTGDHIYVASSDRLMRLPVAGGALEEVASEQPNLSRLAIGRSSVFWTNHVEDGSIAAVSLDGGPVIEVAPGQNRAFDLIADGDSIYWTVEDRVMRLSTAGL